MRRLLGGAVAMGIVAAAAFAGTAAAAEEEVAASSTVVVNEVTTIGPNGQRDEAIEIRNVSNVPQNLGGYEIRVYDQFNTEIDSIPVPEFVTLQPRGNVGEFLVLTGPNFSGTIDDATYVVPFMVPGVQGIPTRGGVALFNENGVKIDGVAFSQGATTPLEGAPAVAENTLTQQLGAANARDILSVDRDNNRVDFTLHQRTLGAVN